jgi:hypothetical protein
MVSHADLLAKINPNNTTDQETYLAPYKALQAVAELHKAQPSTFDDDECAACSNAELSIAYPCETVKVLDKALA